MSINQKSHKVGWHVPNIFITAIINNKTLYPTVRTHVPKKEHRKKNSKIKRKYKFRKLFTGENDPLKSYRICRIVRKQ